MPDDFSELLKFANIIQAYAKSAYPSASISVPSIPQATATKLHNFLYGIGQQIADACLDKDLNYLSNSIVLSFVIGDQSYKAVWDTDKWSTFKDN